MDILLEALDPLAVLRQGMIKWKTYTRIDRMEYMLHYIIMGVYLIDWIREFTNWLYACIFTV